MLFSDTYKEIEGDSQSIYKEKGSKFIAYAYPVYSDNEAKKKIEKIKKKEKSANHYCYAYILHPDKSMHRFNDDGEPNSTAGRPILKQILKYELTNILIVVIRYFGGIKLGIPGLIYAYKLSAKNVIENSNIITKMIKEKYEVLFKHDQMNTVMRLVKEYKLEIIQTDFKINCKIVFLVPKSNSNLVLETLKKNYKLTIKYSS